MSPVQLPRSTNRFLCLFLLAIPTCDRHSTVKAPPASAAPAPRPPASQPLHPDKPPAAPAAMPVWSDPWISTTVQATYLADALLRRHRIDVDTTAGVVTLRGSIHDDDVRSRAIELARSVAGVIRVDDFLCRPATPAMRSHSPTERADRVQGEGAPPVVGDQLERYHVHYLSSNHHTSADIRVSRWTAAAVGAAFLYRMSHLPCV